MRIGMVFHRNPCGPVVAIDTARLKGLCLGMAACGHAMTVVAPVAGPGRLWGLPLEPLAVLETPGRFDAVKACYHQSIKLVGSCDAPVAARIVRVADQASPGRDAANRDELLRCQEIIRSKAALLVLNNEENAVRWRALYGPEPGIAIVPTGCPATIPPPGPAPWAEEHPAVLFLGSLASPRMANMLNSVAEALWPRARVHFIGRSKTHLYGGERAPALHPAVRRHGEVREEDIWGFIGHAHAGLALAAGPEPFDNDVSKILYYLRGGLPVLSEEPILWNGLLRDLDHGRVFRHGDAEQAARLFGELMTEEYSRQREAVMVLLSREHSWDERAARLAHALSGISRA